MESLPNNKKKWKKRMIDLTDCKECPTYSRFKETTRKTICIIHNSPKKISICPCHICLLKAICEQQCKPFTDIAERIFKMHLWYDYKSIYRPSSMSIYNPPVYQFKINKYSKYKRKNNG